jgi:antitoxin HicB
MLAYPARFQAEPEGITVTVRDLPEMVTNGETMAEAMLMAEDALSVVLSLYIEGKRPIPPPTPAQSGERTVFASALVAAKIGLYEAMREHAIGKADLARRLNCHLPQVDRLLDLTHASKLEQVETALAALGKRLAVEVLDAA